MTAATGTGSITINGVTTASIAVTTDAQTSRTNVVKAINDIADRTGVRAIDTEDANQGVQLFAEDGRNITVHLTQTTASFAAATTGLNAATTSATYVGTYSLYSQTGTPIEISHQIGGGYFGIWITGWYFRPT